MLAPMNSYRVLEACHVTVSGGQFDFSPGPKTAADLDEERALELAVRIGAAEFVGEAETPVARTFPVKAPALADAAEPEEA
jgi:hypothetical protein